METVHGMNLEATKPGWGREESGKQMLSLSWASGFQIHPSLLS
jgi:hypothetical protein